MILTRNIENLGIKAIIKAVSEGTPTFVKYQKKAPSCNPIPFTEIGIIIINATSGTTSANCKKSNFSPAANAKKYILTVWDKKNTNETVKHINKILL